MKASETADNTTYKLGPRQSKQVLQIFAKTLNRYQHASTYLQWLEESIMSQVSEDSDLETELTVEDVLRHLEAVQDKCELVKRLYQNMQLDVKKLARNYRNRKKNSLYLDDMFVLSLTDLNS